VQVVIGGFSSAPQMPCKALPHACGEIPPSCSNVRVPLLPDSQLHRNPSGIGSQLPAVVWQRSPQYSLLASAQVRGCALEGIPASIGGSSSPAPVHMQRYTLGLVSPHVPNADSQRSPHWAHSALLQAWERGSLYQKPEPHSQVHASSSAGQQVPSSGMLQNSAASASISQSLSNASRQVSCARGGP
jgi:hypothetical protein